MWWLQWVLITIGVLLLFIVLYDLLQRKHAILKNFPVIGHFRYWLEAIGPELRQYIVTSNDEERPFSRDQRTWVYASSKRQNNYFGFGSDNEFENTSNYLIIKQSAFPLHSPHPEDPGYDPLYRVPCAKVLGEWRKRKKAFRPDSIVNISAMSYGSMSAPAIEALNRGSEIAGCLHNTGEGGISPYHLKGGDLTYQIGTGYFGCRDENGRFSLTRMVEACDKYPQIRAIEVKLSQGAKPGMGGILPRKKITAEIAEIRGISRDHDCLSPASHVEFSDADGLLDFVEKIAEATGLPVGIKAAVGEMPFWHELAKLMATTERGVDFIFIDGGEGGTGAGPLVFTNSVAFPFKIGFSKVYAAFAEQGLQDKVVFTGAGKLGFPEQALFALSLGCDMISVAREAMLAIGCIQAQRCHTGHCPTGVATQNRWLVRGLDPTHKAGRLANYVITLRKELLQIARACGEPHPALVGPEHLEVINDRYGSQSIGELFNYPADYGMPSAEQRDAIRRVMEEITTTAVPAPPVVGATG